MAEITLRRLDLHPQLPHQLKDSSEYIIRVPTPAEHPDLQQEQRPSPNHPLTLTQFLPSSSVAQAPTPCLNRQHHPAPEKETKARQRTEVGRRVLGPAWLRGTTL